MVPGTVGFIPDGNRRYARKKGITLDQAYSEGFDTAENVLDWCDAAGVKNVILWGFSTENFRRSEQERELLFSLFSEHLKRMYESKKLVERKSRVLFAGVKEFLDDPRISKWVRKIEEKTREFAGKTVYIALGYGGRAELLQALRERVERESDVLKRLWIPLEPDLIIRTGGYQRLSGFMLWQAAYSELYFTKKLWPEFDETEFKNALKFYASSQRNFGI